MRSGHGMVCVREKEVNFQPVIPMNNKSRNDFIASRFSRWMLTWFVMLLVGNSTGCSTLFGRKGGPGQDLDLSQLHREGYTVGANGVLQGGVIDETSVLLEVNNGKKHLEKIPMPDGQPMFVADVIRDAQLHKKIGRIHVRLLRPNGTAVPVRMDIDFDDSGRRVREGTNYSLRPGDRIIVTKDDSNFVSRMMSTSSLSGLMR